MPRAKKYPVNLGWKNEVKGDALFLKVENYLRYEKRYSDQNLKNHMINIRRIHRDYGITIPTIEDAYRIEGELSPRVKSTHIRNILRALELMAEAQGAKLKLRKPKRQYVRPKPLSLAEIRMLRASFDNDRDRAIGDIHLVCLVRVNELVRLDVRDVDLKGGELHIRRHTKNRKDRVASINDQAAATIGRWLSIRPDIPDQRALFLTVKGDRIGSRRVQEIVDTAGKKAGIGEKVHPHKLRHSGACQMLRSGFTFAQVACQLGDTLDSARNYIHDDEQGLKDNMKNFRY